MTDTDLDGRVPVADLDRATAATAAGLLRPACASARWIERMVSGRPHGSLPALVAASDATIAALGWPDIEHALAAHPRIGARLPDQDARPDQAPGRTRAASQTGRRPGRGRSSPGPRTPARTSRPGCGPETPPTRSGSGTCS